MQQLESEFQRLIVATRGEAAADTLGDAMILITDMWGQAEMRKILLAVVGLDDILATGHLGEAERAEVSDVQGRLRGVLDMGLGAGEMADDMNDYAVAMFMIGAIYRDFEHVVYDRLEAVHLEMVAAETEAEEAAAKAALAAVAAVAAAEAAAAAAAATAAAAAATAAAAEADQKQRMISARLARFG